jgi:hypothetical protein
MTITTRSWVAWCALLPSVQQLLQLLLQLLQQLLLQLLLPQ